MKITWLLFLLWVAINLLDLNMSYLAECFGAGGERGALALVSSSWLSFSVNKMCLALLVGGLLVYYKRNIWLAILNMGMAGLCVYNGCVLLAHLT